MGLRATYKIPGEIYKECWYTLRVFSLFWEMTSSTQHLATSITKFEYAGPILNTNEFF